MSSSIDTTEAQTEPCPACGSVLDVTGAQIFAERTCPVCGTQINVRRTFGHYELMSQVGHGGQGIVYRAVDNTLNRLVALKLLRTEYSSDPEFVRQFESEAQVTASINHPNVVRVFSFGSGEGHVFLAMELVDKGTFDDLMEKLTRVPEARALQIGIEIARGLKAGFERGLIHRDVKPGNILFADDGSSKIVDFGLAMFFEQSANQTGEIWGTPYYLSPERLNRVAEDFRSDIYSLGATLFHAIAGRPPFEAEDASHVALKHLRAKAVSIQSFAPDVSNATAYVINRTLTKDPAQRQQSYDEFIEQLQFAREEALARAQGKGGQQRARVVLDDVGSQRAKSWVTIAFLGILVVGLIAGGLLLSRALRGDKEENKVTEVGSSKLSGFGPGWQEAEQALLEKNFAGATSQFAKLALAQKEGSTERAWAIVHQALAMALDGDTVSASAKLDQLAGGGTQVSKFYQTEVAPKLSSMTPIPASAAREFNNPHEGLAALFFAIKDNELGAVDDTRALIGQFNGMKVDPSFAWMADYRPLTKPIQEELDIFSLASGAWTNARTPKDRIAALDGMRDALQKLSPTSKLRPKLEQLITTSQTAVQIEHEARMKVNIAMTAKATASSFFAQNQDKAERAIDGDYKSRWRTDDKDKDRWLQLDLGISKPISRWVVRTGSSGGEKMEDNLCDFKLQGSDDGKKWQDIDVVTENRAGIIDRVVPEFRAAFVRVVCQKAVKGNVGRIYELELTAASEQAKAEYQPAESLAMRFSPNSPLVAGPVGEPSAKGNVSFDEGKKQYKISGSGGDIWGSDDSFEFAWTPVKGDCEIVACVRSFSTKHEWSKAGVFIRSELTKNASQAGVAMGSGSKLQFLHRTSPGGTSNSTIKNDTPLPHWVKIVRSGVLVTGYESPDGKKWTEVGHETLGGLGTNAFIGIGVCSHVNGEIATAEFSDVSVTPKP